MKKYVYIIVGIASMLMAVSCQKDAFDASSAGEGGFSLALSMTDSETVATRAAMTNDEAIANANVKIYKPLYAGLIREYTYNAMPEVVYLPTGEGYRVDVVAGEAALSSPRKANFEQKSYKGSANFNVDANQITEDVSVTAKVCNAITNATFDTTISENFNNGYTLTFSLAEGETDTNKTLVYDSSKSGADGYFIIDNLLTETKIYWVFQGTLTDGTAFEADGVINASTDSDSDGNNDLAGARQKMTFKYVVKDGTLKFTLEVDTNTNKEDDIIMWNPTSTGISTSKPYEIWATFATVHADVDTDSYDADKVYFRYRAKTDSNDGAWSSVQAPTPSEDGAPYDATIKGLNANTEYEYQLVLWTKATTNADGTTNAGVETVIEGVSTFTTGKAQQVPNASFEEFHTGTSGYDENVTVFYPSGGTPWWGSGNQTATVWGITARVEVTTADSSVPHTNNNKTSAKLKSEVVSNIKFAAGNIYSGSFAGLDGTNGTVHFGRTMAADGEQFTSRPTGVSFYVRYIGKTVDKACDKLKEGAFDEGQVKFAIGTWGKKAYGGSDESPLAVNTADTGTFWDIASLDETIAYCDEIYYGNGNDTGWQKVTLKFDYKNSNKFPTHIIISAAASRYGDYFAGGSDSTMWLDDIQLLYDHPDAITAETVAVQ